MAQSVNKATSQGITFRIKGGGSKVYGIGFRG
jgi:hypothetical protein